MTQDELIIQVTREIKGLSSNFSSDDYTDAVGTACRETGFSLPSTSDFQIKWLIDRTKRALYFSLLSENAESFKFKQLSLNHKFDNFLRLIEMMDKLFAAAIAENPTEFAGVESYQLFGTRIGAGFAYDETGNDLTYESDQLVPVQPGDE